MNNPFYKKNEETEQEQEKKQENQEEGTQTSESVSTPIPDTGKEVTSGGQDLTDLSDEEFCLHQNNN